MPYLTEWFVGVGRCLTGWQNGMEIVLESVFDQLYRGSPRAVGSSVIAPLVVRVSENHARQTQCRQTTTPPRIYPPTHRKSKRRRRRQERHAHELTSTDGQIIETSLPETFTLSMFFDAFEQCTKPTFHRVIWHRQRSCCGDCAYSVLLI